MFFIFHEYGHLLLNVTDAIAYGTLKTSHEEKASRERVCKLNLLTLIKAMRSNTIEEEAQEQVYRMAKSEAYNDCLIRIMPDCHAGKGCTVGTVIKIKDKVVPNTVGVDIGCGIASLLSIDTIS